MPDEEKAHEDRTQMILREAEDWTAARKAEGWTREDFLREFGLMLGIEDGERADGEPGPARQAEGP